MRITPFFAAPDIFGNIGSDFELHQMADAITDRRPGAGQFKSLCLVPFTGIMAEKFCFHTLFYIRNPVQNYDWH